MKNKVLILCLAFLALSCEPDDDNRQRNPNLVDVNFRHQLNLDLPEYNDLRYPGNSFVTYNYGVRGIVVYNINNSQYSAFELSDPNHPPSQCSAMAVEGILATCRCDDGNSYNIITGEPSEGELRYGMKPYRVERRGNMIEIYN